MKWLATITRLFIGSSAAPPAVLSQYDIDGLSESIACHCYSCHRAMQQRAKKDLAA